MIQNEYDEIPPILKKVLDHGFVIFQDGDYDLNIVGVRNLNSKLDNQFDDKLIVAYRLKSKWITEEFIITTDPGRYWLTKKDYKACAIYKHPQQARGAYKIGNHRGYEACVQRHPVEFWRDSNKDEHADYNCSKVYKAAIGLNLHRASTNVSGSKYVDRWSAGCQVFKYADIRGFKRFMWLCHQQIKSLNYRTFTYTLIGE